MNKMREFVLFLVLALPLAVWAGSGKIAGKVVDATGEAVIGASVQLIETQQGSAVGVDGNYVILGVQPGSYTVRITSVGYGTQTITGVTVSSDVTTTVNATLQEQAIQIEVPPIVYKPPVVKLDVTNRDVVFSGKDLEMRAIQDIGSLLEKQPGFKVDAEGNIHVRGGRESETLVQVDGVSYRDPLVDSTRQLGSFSSLNIQEIEVLTGGDARYGGYQAALINVSTPEGSMTDYAGTIEYRTDRVVPGQDKVDKHGISYRTNSFNQDQYDFSFSGPVPFAGRLLGDKKLSFFTSGMAKLSNTYIPYKVNREANDYMGLGFDIPERQANDYSTFWKLTYRMDEAKKLNLTYSRDFAQWDIYPDGGSGIGANYGWQYKYDVEHRPWTKMSRQTINVGFSNNISKNTLYEVSFGNFFTATDILPRGKTPGEFTLRRDASGGNLLEDTRRSPNSTADDNNDGFIDGYVDANGNGQRDGEGEGYDDANFNGRWDRGEDWVDLNGNGVYDASEPWLDRANSQGVNNLGVWDPWDPFVDMNHNGRWDSAEPQLPEQDWNHNGQWDGERFIDANNNGIWDGTSNAEGYDDKNRDGKLDKQELFDMSQGEDRPEPYVDGDRWYDTGEPFIDLPDSGGFYNGVWDPGEIYYDLPSSFTGQFRTPVPTTNGQYDAPNGVFDEYELFTYPATMGYGMDPRYPVLYTWEDITSPHGVQHGGQEWLNLGYDPTSYRPLYLYYDPAHSTWTNTTTDDNARPVFDIPNFRWDVGKETFTDYNGNGVQDPIADNFVNPGLWDATAYWMKRQSSEWTGKFDLTSQVNKFHELKTGFELKYRDMQMNALTQPDLPYSNPDVPLPPGSPYPDRGGEFRDFYHYRPWDAGFYVQDKMEFEGMIVRAGIRGDFFIQDKAMREDAQNAVDKGIPFSIVAQRGQKAISPRLGISHPISTRSKLYFNYGHYYQMPSFEYLYRSATSNIAPNTLIGNPNLKYEKTISYEVGVNTEFAEDWVVDVAGYYRDVFDQVGTLPQSEGPVTTNRYANLGYSRARGFEFTLKKSLAAMWALQFNYDYSYAYGKESAATAALQNQTQNTPTNWDEYPLAWDETHKVSAFLTLTSGEKDKPRLFGVRMPNDWVSTVEFAYGSGLPYTPSTATVSGNRLRQSQILTNSARYPFTMTVDLKADKFWTPVKGLRLATGVEIYNLLNRRNVRELYAATGNPWDSSHALDTSVRDDNNLGTDKDHNPRNYLPMRQILLHLRLQF